MKLENQLDAHLTLLSFVLSVTGKDTIVPPVSQAWAMKTMVQRFLANDISEVEPARELCRDVLLESRRRAAVHV